MYNRIEFSHFLVFRKRSLTEDVYDDGKKPMFDQSGTFYWQDGKPFDQCVLVCINFIWNKHHAHERTHCMLAPTHIHTHAHAHTHTHTHTHIHTHSPTITHIHTYSHTFAHTHAPPPPPPTHTHTHTHTQIHTYTHIHTHARAYVVLSWKASLPSQRFQPLLVCNDHIHIQIIPISYQKL